MESTERSVKIYPLGNYNFVTKVEQRDPSTQMRMDLLREDYQQYGMQTTVEGVLVVHHNNTPMVLLLEGATNYHKLPSGIVLPGEEPLEGMKRVLHQVLDSDESGKADGDDDNSKEKWVVATELASWWRPDFTNHRYPYVPSGSEPKERIRVFLIQLPERALFNVPSNLKMTAAPMHEMHGSGSKYGPIISSLPVLLSGFNLICVPVCPACVRKSDGAQKEGATDGNKTKKNSEEEATAGSTS